jgi:hypothetical protein
MARAHSCAASLGENGEAAYPVDDAASNTEHATTADLVQDMWQSSGENSRDGSISNEDDQPNWRTARCRIARRAGIGISALSSAFTCLR